MNKNSRKSFCKNCGKFGHSYKHCNEPITSFGVVCMYIDDTTLNNSIRQKFTTNKDRQFTNKNVSISYTDGVNYESETDMKLFDLFKDNIKFLMIQRKHTLGFLEFLRGRYEVHIHDSIKYLFKQMVKKEIDIIKNTPFDDIWNETWKYNKFRNSAKYIHEYEVSKKKFAELVNTDKYKNLNYYIDNIAPIFTTPEWGFPKGRRNFYESDYDCANREFNEETGLCNQDYIVLNKIKPIDEILIGTDNVKYKHIYYPALIKQYKEPLIDSSNSSQIAEIGRIGWYTYYDALSIIRPYHIERKNILTQLYMYIINNIGDIIKENTQN
jgi:ADP-ribose pyrophosphatase YjhB (NUDIX family)